MTDYIPPQVKAWFDRRHWAIRTWVAGVSVITLTLAVIGVLVAIDMYVPSRVVSGVLLVVLFGILLPIIAGLLVLEE